MANQIGDRGAGLSSLTPEQRELDRWLTMARYSIVMTTAKSADERRACAEAIFDKFRDVPNQQPSRQDTAAYARFAARTFLDALITSEGKHESENRSSVVTEDVFNEWIDEWLPPSHAPSMTLPRM